ncbi:hypothetical protein ONS96_006029 [Cadophora gregata f. sp. sojae]|nr:hypothetical protein ONS96_006029 [Cadophora gregata f. sp. sojae]
MSLIHTLPRVDLPYLTITMTGHSHDVEIELFDNSSDDGDSPRHTPNSPTCTEESRSPSQDLSEDFRSCVEALTPRQSVEEDIVHDRPETSSAEHGREVESCPTLSSSARSSLSSQEGSSAATLRPTRTLSREAKRDSNEEEHSSGKHSLGNVHRIQPEPSIKVSMAEDSSPDSASPKLTKSLEPIYIGGLKVIREVDSDSARSPTIGSPTVPTAVAASRKQQSQGSITLLDSFGRSVWVHRNDEEEMDEVRVDEDGNYYVFGQGGFRVRLKEGQIQSDNTSQPFCISNGQKINIRMRVLSYALVHDANSHSVDIVPDLLRTSALQDPRPENDGTITPRTEPIVNNRSDSLPSPHRNVTRPANIRTTTQKTRLQHSRTPWTDLFTGVAEKSKNATTYLTKGARSKMRRSPPQPAQPSRTQQQSTSRTTSRTSSANKSAVETGNSRETRGRRVPFLGQVPRIPPVGNIKKRVMSRRHY